MKMKYWPSFSKRKNSTKIPSGTATEIDILLKEDTGIDNPSIVLTGNELNIDYAYIQEFNKYYFVSAPVILTDGMTQYNLEEDALATHKTEVGNTIATIAYSSTGYDTKKVDSRLPIKIDRVVHHDSDTAGIFDSTGCYVITVIADGSATGMTCQYAMEQNDLQTLAQALFLDLNVKQAVENYVNKPFDAVVGCKWVPFSYSEMPGSSGEIIFAGQGTGAYGKKIPTPSVKSSSVTLSIPWEYNDFRRSAPYTSIACWLPGFGFIELNASDLVELTSLKFDFMCDCATGNICCNIIDPVTSEVYTSHSYDASCDIPISSVSMNVSGVVNGLSGVAGQATGSLISAAMLNLPGVLASGVGLLQSGANTILSANQRTVSTRGSLAGRAIFGFGTDVDLYTYSVVTEDPNNANYIAKWGRPVGLTHAINNHSGYVQCDGASVDIAGDNAEREAINSFLNSGFYYE